MSVYKKCSLKADQVVYITGKAFLFWRNRQQDTVLHVCSMHKAPSPVSCIFANVRYSLMAHGSVVALK